MCVLALAWKAHPHWELVVAGNRDEYHARPADPLSRWNAPHTILAGRDLQSGGTWLGISERGTFGVITNFRGFGPPRAGQPSRGILLRDLISGAGEYSNATDTDLAKFNPFNPLNVERRDITFITNRPAPARQSLVPGTYALSNGTLDEPWLKTLKLKRDLVGWLDAGTNQPDELLNALRDGAMLEAANEFGLNDAILASDPLSPIFIQDPVYGTRCSTVVAIDNWGLGTIIERRFGSLGEFAGESITTFTWPI